VITALDTETHLIKPGCVAPKLVCVTTSDEDDRHEILNAPDGLAQARALLEGGELVGHHVFFDLCVLAAEDPDLLPLIFKAIDEGRVHCTKIRQMIIDNAEGQLKFIFNEETNEYKKQSFSLATLVYRHLSQDIQSKKEGDDIWRLRYNELDGVPIEEWPDEAVTYAISDAILTREVFFSQESYCAPRGLPGGTQGEIWQTQAAWALYLAGAWGVRTDPEAVSKLRVEVEAEYAEVKAVAQKWGFVRKGIKESRNITAIREAVEDWYRARERPFKYTASGKVSTDREQLTEIECECGFDFKGCNCEADGVHRGLWAVAEVVRLQKLLSTYIKALERGTDIPLCPSYNPIIETFRTSCSQGMKIDGVPMGTQLQNPPRKHGVRECFVPREGWLFAFCDYDTLEMLTLAQVCLELFGYSNIAEAAWRGEDFHLALAADMMAIDYADAQARLEDGDELMIDMRQGCKIGNYGFAGGMSWRTFVAYAKGFGAKIDPAMAKKLHAGFRRKWREMNDYFRFVSSLIGDGNRAHVVEFPRSKMMRGNVPFCATANGFFQERAAQGAKAALYQVSKECYTDKGSALYGCRPWLFAHDEIGMEIPYSGRQASDAALRLQSAMVEQMKSWCPDVPIAATAVMSRRWYKGAKPIFKGDMLVPCKPEGKKWVESI
jgi:hypothetical protein